MAQQTSPGGSRVLDQILGFVGILFICRKPNQHANHPCGYDVTPGKRGDDWRTLTEEGVALLQQAKPQQALAHLERAHRRAPGNRDVRYWLANACRMNGEIQRAAHLFEELLAERPADFEASFALAFLLREAGMPGDAADTLLQASAQRGLSVEQLLQITGFLRDSNEYSAAIKVCEKAVALQPGQADLHFKLGRLYQATGAFGQSLAAFRKTLDLQPATGPAWTVLAQQKTFHSPDDPDYVRIQAAAERSYGDEADMCIAFASGKALDDLKRWPAAWQQYQMGNQLASAVRPWSQASWQRFVDRAIGQTSVAESDVDDNHRNAVFIVGMLRSGTTLLEQRLNRHPDIIGRGELNFLAQFAERGLLSGGSGQIREMAEYLWTQMRLEGPEGGTYIDKNPLNFRYLDSLFALIPTAKVLHVTRDGRDSCLSCFFQLFEHEDAAFSNNLDYLVAFYAGYRRLMAHWETLYADRIQRVDYADLVRNTDRVLADTVDFLGVNWDDALKLAGDQQTVVRTASVWQARQPVHSRSLERWRNYSEQAPQFFAQLASIDEEFGGSGAGEATELETGS